jgi:hypothetical protein
LLQPQKAGEPTQKINKQPYTYTAAFEELQRLVRGGAVWAKRYLPHRKADGKACLVCKLCRTEVSAGNISDSTKTHNDSEKCKRLQADIAAAAETADVVLVERSETVAAAAGKAKQITFEQLLANKAQREEMLKQAALYF